jgi:hypothetical protein
VCHVDLDQALAAAKQETEEGSAAAEQPHSHPPKSSKKRDRSAREAEGDEGAGSGAMPVSGVAPGAKTAAPAAAANFSMVHKYGPLLCAEFLTGHNLLLVERSHSLPSLAPPPCVRICCACSAPRVSVHAVLDLAPLPLLPLLLSSCPLEALRASYVGARPQRP